MESRLGGPSEPTSTACPRSRSGAPRRPNGSLVVRLPGPLLLIEALVRRTAQRAEVVRSLGRKLRKPLDEPVYRHIIGRTILIAAGDITDAVLAFPIASTWPSGQAARQGDTHPRAAGRGPRQGQPWRK